MWWLTTETYSLSVLEARLLVQSQGVGRAPLPSKALGKEESFPASSSCWWLPAILGAPWLRAALTPTSSSGCVPCVCLSLRLPMAF